MNKKKKKLQKVLQALTSTQANLEQAYLIMRDLEGMDDLADRLETVWNAIESTRELLKYESTES